MKPDQNREIRIEESISPDGEFAFEIYSYNPTVAEAIHNALNDVFYSGISIVRHEQSIVEESK